MKQTLRTLNLRHCGGILLAVGLCIAPATGYGSVVRALNLDQQIGLSDLVVEGRVGLHQQSIDPVSGRPMTDTAIHVVEVLHGRKIETGASRVLQIRQIRGYIRGELLSVTGDPTLKTGEHVILMLRQVDGRYYLTALSQSVFWIDASTNPPRVEQRLDGLVRVSELGGGRVRAPDPTVPTLAELRQAIRKAEVGR